MRIKILYVYALLVICTFPAVSIAEQESLPVMLQQLRMAQDSNSPLPAASINFVVGNDLWQPGEKFKSENGWLALACNAKGCALEPSTLKVRQESWQGHYDDTPTAGQLLTFHTDGQGKIVAWFYPTSLTPWIKPGPVPTYYSPQRPLHQPIGRGTLEALIELPSGEHSLLVPLLLTKEFQHRLEPEERSYWPLVVLQLRSQNKRQLLQGHLGTCSGKLDPHSYLLWAGDLDRDGKPDYLISFVDADGPIHLYLSSNAKQSQLVELAGIYNSPPFGGECDGPGGFMQFDEAEND